MHKIECPKCGGQGSIIVNEFCNQYDRTHLQWDICGNCGGEGQIELEPQEDVRLPHHRRRDQPRDGDHGARSSHMTMLRREISMMLGKAVLDCQKRHANLTPDIVVPEEIVAALLSLANNIARKNGGLNQLDFLSACIEAAKEIEP